MKSPEMNMDVKKTSKEQEFPEIKLPEDVQIVERMKTKLEEYKRRLLLAEQEGDGYKSPEQVNKIMFKIADTSYKIAILEKLLLEGVVDKSQLLQELRKKDQFDEQIFNCAYNVIKDYATTGGKRTYGGTGLR